MARSVKDSPHSRAPLFTIGYEKAKLEAVIGELRRAKVGLLIDTRAVATSRRPGFSKRALAASLEDAGIAYIHLQKLGTPAAGRQAARAGDFDTLWGIYDKHIKTPDAQAALAELIGMAKAGRRVCLLCYERDPNECHRSRIAELVKRRIRTTVKNLIPPLF